MPLKIHANSTMKWTPVCYFYHGFSLEELTAMYYVADIALMTPLRDDMNLVAKEYVATKCNNTGVLILSEMAGAAVEMSDALLINPYDTEQIEKAICQALEMPEEEQKRRLRSMQAVISTQTVDKWATDFVSQLKITYNMNEELRRKKLTASTIDSAKLKYNQANKRLILLDYDGTLMALKSRPKDAVPTPELLTLLQQLANDTLNKVVINSGRDHRTLEQWLGHLPITMAAEHGAFYKENGNWTNRTKKYSLYNEVIERSMLVLKMMSYYNGAVLAALTTSLPETVGGVRNWDYRFCWLRDASMSIETMFHIGHTGAARKFMKFIQSAFVSQHKSYQIMYGIHGERQLTETILEHLSGYKNSKPVRIGNDAYHQKQNDSFGYLMDLIYQYYCLMPGTLDEIEDMWEMVKSILSTVIDDWKKPDKGIWEIRGKSSHFVSSKVMCWVVLDRGAKIGIMLKKHDYSEKWQQEADKIHADVWANGWKEEIQGFSQTYSNLAQDSSLLLMEPYGFINADDIHYHKTVDTIRKALFHKGLMYRYNTKDDFGMPTSAFTICTFWLIRALFVTGRKEEACCLFDEVLQYSNHLGLFSEDIHFETKEQSGNFPQAYSHLALVNTAILFAEEEKRLTFHRP